MLVSSGKLLITCSASSLLPGFSLRQLRTFAAGYIVGRDEINMADAERGRDVIKGHDGRIAQTAFEIADILLRIAGRFGETLLGESLLPAQSRKIPTHQLAHVHGRKLRQYALLGLSRIICIMMVDFPSPSISR